MPTLNMIIWINESMQQARYLYMPGVWLALFVASVLSKCGRGWAAPLLALWAAANLAGLERNLGIYRSTLVKTQIISERVRQDYSQTLGARTILVQDLAEQPNGVFFGGSELISRIQTALPDASSSGATANRRTPPVRIFGTAGIRRRRTWFGNSCQHRAAGSRCYDGRAFPRL